MDENGTVFSYHKGDTVKYGAAPFVLGIYEFQQGRINREMAELYERYFEEAFFKKVGETDQLLRPIPVGRSLDISHPVATYNDVREIIRKQNLIAVAPFLCRIQAGLLGKGCGKPLEVKQKDQYQVPYDSAREMMMSITEKRGTSLIPLSMQKQGSE